MKTGDVKCYKTEEKTKEIKNFRKSVKYGWVLKISVLTLALALAFSILSELTLSVAGITVSILIILILLMFGILFDMIAVAFSSCPKEPLSEMVKQNVKGSKVALVLLKHADKMNSFCADVIGDICGILSGAAGSAITIKLVINLNGSLAVLVAAAVSALIAGASVFSKAMFKRIAIDKSVNIVMWVGKTLSIFMRNK